MTDPTAQLLEDLVGIPPMHAYQHTGMDHIRRNDRAALFLDMGLCRRLTHVPEPIAKMCPECRTEQLMRPDQKYCGTACRLLAMSRRNRSDPVAQAVRGKLGGRVRGEQLRAARKTDWYSKQDGLHVHRTVAEACLGRPLERGEIIHHEDRNKMNNHPSNLIVFPSQSVHAQHHGRGHCGQPCDCTCIRLGVMPQ